MLVKVLRHLSAHSFKIRDFLLGNYSHASVVYLLHGERMLLSCQVCHDAISLGLLLSAHVGAEVAVELSHRAGSHRCWLRRSIDDPER